MVSENLGNKGSIGNRFAEEMRTYAAISLYLWICFGVLMLYESVFLRAADVAYLPFGTAAIKALVLGKFILIGKAMNVGGRVNHGVLLHRILLKSLAVLLLLMVFTMMEELIVGLVHGQAIADIVADFFGKFWLQRLASSVVMLLVLIPMISFEEVDNALGKGSLKRLLLGH